MAAFDSDVDVTVEIAPGSGPLDDSPTWQDISTSVRAGSWGRGRSSVHAEFPAGQGSVTLDNTDGHFYPWNTSGDYYPDLTVGVPIRIRATHDNTTYSLFYGYVQSWPAAYPTSSEELITLPMIETFARLQGKRVSGTFAAGKSDVRVGDLLDAASWPAGLRDLDDGVAEVAAITVQAEQVLALLRAATEAEAGQLFQDAAGQIAFRNRVAVPGSASATFGPDGSELTYVDVTATLDDDLLFNEARIVAADEDEQVVSDATSIAAHGEVTYESNNPSIPSGPWALSAAEWVVGRYKDVGLRIEGFSVDPGGDPDNLWPVVLDLDLRDVVKVEASFPGSPTQMVQTAAVGHIAHSFDMVSGVWSTVYRLDPISTLEQREFWILGTSKLGSETRLA